MNAATHPTTPDPGALAEVTRRVLARACDPAAAAECLAEGLRLATSARLAIVVAGADAGGLVVASPAADAAALGPRLREALVAAATSGRFTAGADRSALARSLDGAQVLSLDAGGVALGAVALAAAAPLLDDALAEAVAATRALGLTLAHDAARRTASELERARLASSAGELRYRALLGAMPDAVLHLDTRGTVLDLKPAEGPLALGLPTDAIGRHMTEVLPSRAVQPLRRALRDALDRGVPQQLDCTVEHETGRRFWEVRVVANGPDNGFAVVHDVTGRRRFEDEVRELNAQLERRVVERTEELAAASRDVEAFLQATVDGLAAPLRRIDAVAGPFAPPGGGTASVREAVVELLHTVEGLAELARIGKAELTRAPVDMSALAAELAVTIAARAPDRRAHVTVHDGLGANADATLLRWALEELLENAFRYTDDRADATIEVGTVDAGGEAAFYVRDDGRGFDPSAAHRLFRPFERIDEAGGGTGAGLGLAIVARVVGRHGGRTWADSRRGHGSTFYFTLPCPDASPDAALEAP